MAIRPANWNKYAVRGEFSILIDLLETRAAEQPDFPQYRYLPEGEDVSETLTLSQLWEHSRAIAARLQENGDQGERVILLFMPGLEFLPAFFGCLLAGRLAVPMPPPRPSHMRHRLEKLLQIAASAEPTTVLTTADLRARVLTHKDDLPALKQFHWVAIDEISTELGAAWEKPNICGDDIAFLQYTSGSTSLPKGVMLSHTQLLHNMHYFDLACVHGPDARLLNWLPPFHDHGLIYGLLTPVYVGMPCYVMPNMALVQKPSRWMIAASRYRITHSMGPNSMFGLCAKSITDAELDGLDLSALQHITNGAEPVRMATLREFVNRFSRAGLSPEALAPAWGLAEGSCILTGSHAGAASDEVSQRRLPREVFVSANALAIRRLNLRQAGDEGAVSLTSSGFPLGDVELQIVDPDSCQLCPPDCSGEVWVRAKSVASGYWNNPEKTTETFDGCIDGDETGKRYLRTGDLGFMLDGELFVAGRIKDLIIVHGQNHYPQDIEWSVEQAHALLRSAGAAAFSVECQGEEQLVVVAEVGRQFKAERDGESVFQAVRGAVSNHGLQAAAITLIHPSAALKTTSGKIQRAATRRAFLQGDLRRMDEWIEPGLRRHVELARHPQESASTEPETLAPLHTPGIVHVDAASLRTWLIRRIAELAGLEQEQIHGDLGFGEFGLDSQRAVQLSGELQREFALPPLPPALLYDHPNINALVSHLAPQQTFLSQDAFIEMAGDDVAIVGMACRFPGAPNLAAFSNLIRQGRCAIAPLPAARRALLGDWAASGEQLGDAGYIDDIDGFAPSFFHVSGRQAEQMDPQQRWLLMTVWHALEHAGIAQEELQGSRTGVFIGLSSQDYNQLLLRGGVDLDGYAGTGLAGSIAANRISYFLDLHGPSFVIDTACSSSLVAFHLARHSILRGECDTALVAGVNVLLNPALSAAFRQAGMLSPTARCHSFDAQADGYVRGEGVGVVVLRRRSLAVARGNRLWATVAGSAINEDGRSFGLTAPNGAAQREVLRAALDDAGLSADAIDYIEAHGTGTALGDPIEAEALANTLGNSKRERPCYFGSVKANIGHLEAAAGIAGLIKATLCLVHNEIPPLAGFVKANPRVPLDGTLAIHAGSESLIPPLPLRHVGVTSMGFGGANAHVVLARAPQPARDETQIGSETPAVLLITADTEKELQRLANGYAVTLQQSPQQWRSYCEAAVTGRSRLRERVGFAADHAEQLLQQLHSFTTHGNGALCRASSQTPQLAPVFVFGGQGTHSPRMGADLYQRYAVFRTTLDECDAAVRQYAGESLLSMLYGDAALDGDKLRDSVLLPASVLSVQLALARTLEQAGIQPGAVMGHSIGEYGAACFAGVMNIDDMVSLVLQRTRLIAELTPPGAMVALAESAETVGILLQELLLPLDIAAINGPRQTVVAGIEEHIAALCAACRERAIPVQRLAVSRAFHSRLLDPILMPFRDVAAGIAYEPPRIPVIGNTSGAAVKQFDADYWVHHLRQPVQFSAAVQALGSQALFVELSPQPALQSALHEAPGHKAIAVSTARAPLRSFLAALAHLDCLGARVAWRELGFTPNAAAELPLYSFDLSKHWIIPTVVKEDIPMPFSNESSVTPENAFVETIERILREELSKLLKCSAESLDPSRPFLEMGADSLVLVELVRSVETRFGVRVELGQLFTEWPSAAELAAHVATHAPRQALRETPSAAPFTASNEPVPLLLETATLSPQSGITDPHHEVLKKQLDTFQWLIEAQLATLTPSAAAQRVSKQAETVAMTTPSVSHAGAPQTAGVSEATLSRPLAAPAQAAHIARLVCDYQTKTAGSKRYAEQYRHVFADYRSSLGFRSPLKELIYPLVVQRAEGSRVWDIDGNAYIDLSMGFGSCLLGHNPPLVIEALRQQLPDGIQVGPKSPLSGEAAQLIAQLTGSERVAFANSGTEAVMTALRLARAVTGKTRFVRFAGSYHGHSDHTLVRTQPGQEEGVPGALGVPPALACEAIVLEYGQPASLERIRAHAHELAAVIVEPVQSRRPGLQPKLFLQQLRQITEDAGCALIFDEIITGFRLAPGGAQEVFGIRADLATYGKVAGGGMPIGVIAGTSRFMDAIDGGAWRFGDDSRPGAVHTFFAGTFSAHPLTMAASVAVLRHMVNAGPQLQQSLSAKAAKLAQRVNTIFVEERFPIRLDYAGSLLRFVFFDNFSVEFQPLEANLFFYNMTLRGVYIWEGHTCFLSIAHSDTDIADIAAAAVDSARAMRRDGLFPLSDEAPRAVTVLSSEAARSSVAQQVAALNDYALALIAEKLHGQASSIAECQALLRQNHSAVAGSSSARERLGARMHHYLSAVVTPAINSATALAACRAAKCDEALLALIDRCGESLVAVLRGERSGTDALFSGDGREALKRLYRSGLGMDGIHEHLARQLRPLAYSNAELRVLEIGAGTGGTTASALAALGESLTEYVFSDISSAFFPEAERQFGTHRGFRCTVLDIAQPTDSLQNLGRFDIVIAANVLHATPDLQQTLRNVLVLLKPGGMMLLIELEQQHPWLDLIFGQTEGWWAYRDWRQVGPLLTVSEWQDVLHPLDVSITAVQRNEVGGVLLAAQRDTSGASQTVALSIGQTGIVLHMEMTSQVNGAYNESMVFEWRGALEREGLRAALNQVIQRHDSLRAHLAEDARHLKIEPQIDIPLQWIDLAMFPASLVRAKAREWVASQAKLAFDCHKAPLLRAAVIALTNDCHWLIFIAHHLIIDGVSYGHLFNELVAAYRARKGETPWLVPPVLSLNEANVRQSQYRGDDRDYWLSQLTPLPPYLDLPADKPYSPAQDYAADRLCHELSADLSDNLRRFCRDTGVTPFMTCFAAFRLFLHRLCGQSRSVIGVPVAVHELRADESFIGFGANVLPLAGETPSILSFADYTRGIREEFLRALKHKSYPLTELVRELNPRRDHSRPTLVTVLFNYENVETLEGPDYQVEPLIPPTLLGKYELVLDVIARGQRLELSLTYASALFEPSTAERMVQRYTRLLTDLLANPQKKLGAFDILLPQERIQLLQQPESETPVQACLHQLFERQAAERPEAVALRFHDESLTYAQLNQRANALAHLLCRQGVTNESRVGVCLPRTPELVVALLAVLKCGAAYAPLDPNYPVARLEAMATAANAHCILVSDPSFAARWPGQRLIVLTDIAEQLSAAPTSNLESSVMPAHLAYLIFTSGSTGAPKAVAIEHQAAASMLHWAAQEFPASSLAGVLASTSVCFDLSVFEMFLPLCYGHKVVLVENVLHLLELGCCDDITLINTVPSAIAELLRADALPRHLKVINLAGEALSDSLVQRLLQTRPEITVYNLYGPSEDTTYSTVFKMAPGFAGTVSIGKPIFGSQLYLLDDDLQPVSPGTKGIIFMAGNGLARGYFNRPDATAEAFVANPYVQLPGARMYRTGDVGRILPSGDIAFLGRCDNQIKLRGHRIELGEIQTAMRAVPGVDQAIVVAVGDVEHRQLIGFFTPSEAGYGPVIQARLLDHLSATLPRYMLPAALIPLECFPLTPNGKVDMQQLQSRAADFPMQTAIRGRTPPRNSLEEKLTEIWSKYLNLQDVSVDEDFFALGGHSLLATRILHDINVRFGCHLKPTDLLRNPTVAQLAERIGEQLLPLLEDDNGNEPIH